MPHSVVPVIYGIQPLNTSAKTGTRDLNPKGNRMTSSPRGEGKSDVPAQIFEKFLEDLEEASVPLELVARLRKALIEEKTFTERALKMAIFTEEPLP
jgi:hypothetical protein